MLFEHELLHRVSINLYETRELQTESHERTVRHIMVVMSSFRFVHSKTECENRKRSDK